MNQFSTLDFINLSPENRFLQNTGEIQYPEHFNRADYSAERSHYSQGMRTNHIDTVVPTETLEYGTSEKLSACSVATNLCDKGRIHCCMQLVLATPVRNLNKIF
jgi:hypothetical protein